ALRSWSATCNGWTKAGRGSGSTSSASCGPPGWRPTSAAGNRFTPGGTPPRTNSAAADRREEMDLARRPHRLQPAEPGHLAVHDDGDTGPQPAGVAESGLDSGVEVFECVDQ